MSKDYTRHVLTNMPVGSMRDADWNEAYPAFLWWTQQGTPESITTAWQLLDRLVQEEQHHDYSRGYLQTHWLNRIVEASRLVTIENEEGEPTLVVGPMEWLERLEWYAPYLLPNSATYSMVMHTLTKWTKEEESTAHVVEQLLVRMHEESQKDNPTVLPDVETYNAVLYAWANSGLEEAPHKAQALFDKMKEHEIQPDQVSYGTLITTWARSLDPNAPLKCLEILRLMEQQGDEPNTIIYNSVMSAWERSSRPDAAQQVDVLFREMMTLYYQNGIESVQPDDTTLRIVLRTILRSGSVARADAIIRQVHEMNQQGELNLVIPRWSFHATLHEWANLRNSKNAGERAESLLRLMIELYVNGNKEMKPKLRNFSPVIAAWTRNANRHGASNAEAILNAMLEFAEQVGDDKMVPNTLMCSSIINAWGRSTENSAPERAKAMLRRMQEWYEAGNRGVQPEIITYNSLLKVYAKSRRSDAPKRIEALLREMGNANITPSRISYNHLINAYANTKDRLAPERAESIVRHLRDRFEAGDKAMKPDYITYTTVIKAWVNSGLEGAAERAEELLRFMQDSFTKTGDIEIRPNGTCFAMVINGWVLSNSPDAAIRAGNLLEEVHDLQRQGADDMLLRKQTYFDVLQLLADSTDVSAGQTSERILLYMYELTEQGHSQMFPSTKFFNFTLRAWAKCGHRLAAPRAESILKSHERLKVAKRPTRAQAESHIIQLCD